MYMYGRIYVYISESFCPLHVYNMLAAFSPSYRASHIAFCSLNPYKDLYMLLSCQHGNVCESIYAKDIS